VGQLKATGVVHGFCMKMFQVPYSFQDATPVCTPTRSVCHFSIQEWEGRRKVVVGVSRRRKECRKRHRVAQAWQAGVVWGRCAPADVAAASSLPA